jgi:glycosyltransferase involved in cell wall biosynthesis
MTIYATSKVAGEYGVPGFGVFKGYERKAVPTEVAVYLRRRPEFQIETSDPSDLALRDEAGRVRFLEYFGPIDSRFGYGGGGISILRALTRLGVQVSVHPHYNGKGDFDVAYPVDLPADAKEQLTPRTWLPDVALCHCLPSDLYRNDTKRKVAWTMWESSRIPFGNFEAFGVPFGNWTEHINRHAERLVVPCRHNAEVFKNCGVDLPITVIPYGLDTDIWPFVERPERDTFTVVQYGDLTSRKGPMEAVAAFQRAFPTERNVRLVLKTQHGRLGDGAMPIFNDPRIQVINATFTRAQLIEMLAASDCFIWLSRGEGFGLPPVQAMLTGLPVVMTTHTGMAEYYRPSYFYGVKDAGLSESKLGGEWYEPDVDHAAEQLRAVYENRKVALRKAKQGAGWLRNNFSLDAFAGRLGAFLETL